SASDPSISGLNLHLDRISIGFAQAQELRNAILALKKQNKPVTCYISYPSNISYYIASAADRIVIAPISQLNLVGLRTELTFYGAALDKLGVNVDLIRIGDYKTAAETFTEHESSDANKKQMNRILDNLYDQFVTDIAAGRNLTPDSVINIINNGPFTSVDAYKFGLVDSLAYFDEYAKQLHKEGKQISLSRYHADSVFTNSWEKKPLIAVLVTEGEVQPDNYSSFYSRGRSVTPRKVQSSLHQLYKSKPDAVILRINSPGGFAMAGEEIYHSLDVYARHKKLYVSMANITASGGYYYAMAAQKIFANPATITGSIGIFGGKADFKQLYEKLYINKELFKRGKYSAMMSNINPFTEEERDKYYYHLRSMYDHFVSLVAGNREMSADSVDNLGQGRVWTGNEAAQNGLVDNVGGLKETIDYVVSDLNLNDYDIEIYPQKRPLFILPGRSMLSPFIKLLTGEKSEDELIESIAPIETAEFYTRLPFDITIQ
ncbi:MAG: signal peptide peptidase SppA, partial [Calditrichaeota bacterium]